MPHMAQRGSQARHGPGRGVVVKHAALGGRRADGHPVLIGVHAVEVGHTPDVHQ